MQMVNYIGTLTNQHYLQSWCIKSLMLQKFYHSIPLAKLIVEVQCFVDLLNIKNISKNKHIMNHNNATKLYTEYICPICNQWLDQPIVLSCAHCVCNSCKHQLTDHCIVCNKIQPLTNKNELKPFLKLHHFIQENKLYLTKVTQQQQQQQEEEEEEEEQVVHHHQPQSEQEQERLTHHHQQQQQQQLFPPKISHVIHSTNGIQYKTLTYIKQLLDIITPNTYIALDIDETIQKCKYSPCLLLSDYGIQEYQSMLLIEPYRSMSNLQLNQRREQLNIAIHSKIYVEDNTKEIIELLQAKNIKIFGLTSRYSNMAYHTHRILTEELDLYLEKTSPFPKDRILRDPITDAQYQNGIIYTNATNKAYILDRFLSNVLFIDTEGEEEDNKSTTFNKPDKIIFLDDRLENVLHLASGVSICQALNIPIEAYHYINPNIMNNEMNSITNLKKSQILKKQIEIFLLTGQIKTDIEINNLINDTTTTTEDDFFSDSIVSTDSSSFDSINSSSATNSFEYDGANLIMNDLSPLDTF